MVHLSRTAIAGFHAFVNFDVVGIRKESIWLFHLALLLDGKLPNLHFVVGKGATRISASSLHQQVATQLRPAQVRCNRKLFLTVRKAAFVHAIAHALLKKLA